MIYIWLYGLLTEFVITFILWFYHSLDSGQKFVKFFVGFLENLKKIKKDVLKLTDLYREQGCISQRQTLI